MLLFLAGAMLYAGSLFGQAESRPDSSILYEFNDMNDSVPVVKEVYDVYDDQGSPARVSTYKWDIGFWKYYGERVCLRDDDGHLLMRKVITIDHLFDRMTVYSYDDNGRMQQMTVYRNRHEGIPLEPDWKESLRETYQYDALGRVQESETYVKANFWQGVRKTFYKYDASDRLVSEEHYKWYPPVTVKRYEGLYSQNPSGSTNYAAIAWKLEPGVTLDELAAYRVNDSTEFVNVYVNDGTQDIRYNLHGVAGKTLAEVFSGQNDESVTINLDQLRDDYTEWFHILEDNEMTLLSCNVKEMRTFRVFEVIVVDDDLYSRTGANDYLNIAYHVKAAATMDDLDKIVLPDTVTWVNVYVKENPDDPEAPYGRVDIYGVGGKTLAEVLQENNIAIGDLATDYVEWFWTKAGERKLARLNIKAVLDLTPHTSKVIVHEMLINAGETNGYISNAYNILESATADDLAEVTLPDTVTFLSVYYNDGSGDQRVSLYEVEGKTLKAVLLDGDNRDGVTIPLDQLRHNYYEWFYGKDGKPVLVNLNVKAIFNMGNTAPVVVTPDLRNEGGDEYLSTAYLIRPHATSDDLKAYVLDNVDFLSVYIFDGTDEVRINLHGINGKTLQEALAGGNDEKITIDLTQLRTNYWEWFRDADNQPMIVNLNVKAVKILHEAPTVEVHENLLSEEGGDIFFSTTYLVKTSAKMDDLASYTVPDDAEVLYVYARPLLRDTVYALTGVAGKDLQSILTGDNDQGQTVDLDDLKEFYAEWFFNTDGEASRVRLNLKASRKLTGGLDELVTKKEYLYSTNKQTITTLRYEGSTVTAGERVTTYFDADGRIIMEETERTSDGNTWTPASRLTRLYDDNRLKVEVRYDYDDGSSDYVLKSKKYYFYYEAPSAVRAAAELTTRFYPNPAGEVLYVTVPGHNTFEYRIYTLTGSLVVSGRAEGSRATLRVNGLPAGIYLLRVSDGKETFSDKFIKQ